ncbi:hypothetical protein [Niallia taxi]|uniref:hypothetical protein n=1 Tax=Niallia taxi TaxID=2499688 RepID=UPI003D2D6C04
MKKGRLRAYNTKIIETSTTKEVWIYDEPIFFRLNEFEIEAKSRHIFEVKENEKHLMQWSALSQAESEIL